MKELRITVPYLGKSEVNFLSSSKDFRKIGHARYLLVSDRDPYDVLSDIISLLQPRDFSVYTYPSFINLCIVTE